MRLFLGAIAFATVCKLSAASPPPTLLWTDSVTMAVESSGRGNEQTLFGATNYPGMPASTQPTGIAVDGGTVFWSDSETGQLLSGLISGAGNASLLYDQSDYPGSPAAILPEGVSVDGTDLYWTDAITGQVLRGSTDGSSPIIELYSSADYPGSPGTTFPFGVDVRDGMVYWSDGVTNQILRGSTDGIANVANIVDSGDLGGLDVLTIGALSTSEDSVFFTSSGTNLDSGLVLRKNLDGSGDVEQLFTFSEYPAAATGARPTSVSYLDGNLYWADFIAGGILSGRADGAGAAALLVESPSPLLIDVQRTTAGDYNSDGTVNAADYTVWRDSFGATGISPWSLGDGNGDGDVDGSDYAVWRTEFGTTLDDIASATSSASVPEPSSLLVLLIGSLAVSRRS